MKATAGARGTGKDDNKPCGGEGVNPYGRRGEGMAAFLIVDSSGTIEGGGSSGLAPGKTGTHLARKW